MHARRPLVALAASALIGLAGCGSSDDAAQDLQNQAEKLQKDANKISEDVRSGKLDPQKAARKIEKDAQNLADDAIQKTKDQVPGGVKKQLDQAQDQLNTP